MTVLGCMVLIMPGERRLLGEETFSVLKVAPGFPRELALFMMMVVEFVDEESVDTVEAVVVILIP